MNKLFSVLTAGLLLLLILKNIKPQPRYEMRILCDGGEGQDRIHAIR